jgi:hypothetical protein
MSRTKRVKAKKALKHKYFRDPRTKNAQTAEYHAAVGLTEAGFPIANRHAERANPTSGQIPSSWDDLDIAASREIDYRKGQNLE